MWINQKSKKLLLFVLLNLCLLFPVFSQEDSSNKINSAEITFNFTKLQQGLNLNLKTSINKMNNSLPEQNDLSQNSLTSIVPPTDAYQLLDNLEMELQNLLALSNNLDSELTDTKKQLLISIQNCQELRNALISNKEDTETALMLLGELNSIKDSLSEQVLKETSKNKNSYVFTTTTLTLLGLFSIGAGAYLLYKQDPIGKPFIIASSSTFAVIQLTYQLGHFAFTAW